MFNSLNVSIMSQIESISYPKIHLRTDGRVEVIVNFNGKRMRLQNGSSFGIHLKPNSFPKDQRINQAQLLASQIYSTLLSGYNPFNIAAKNRIQELSDIEILKYALNKKVEQGISKHYHIQLKYSLTSLMKHVSSGEVTSKSVEETLMHFTNPTSYNTMRRGLIVLFNKANELGWKKKPMKSFKNKRAKAKLNKPFKDVPAILREIREYNSNLHLCCLLTYGCLLRPHREIRELTWGDFTDNLDYIRLSGDRNKSGRNRIVPVPYYVKEFLKKSEDHLNIFTGTEQAYDADYFKGLWTRFKKRTSLLEKNQTLYSFRHTGAIDVYKRSGSIEKLKAVMGHSNVMVSLTYLRGLDMAELQEKDMPMLPTFEL